MYNSRLLSEPKLRDLAAIADEISNHCTEITDALCDYESAADLPSGERTDARGEARDAVWSALGDLLTEAARLQAERDKLDVTLA